jgi:aminoglycoside phosphotransferase (APT) family kinase protein
MSVDITRLGAWMDEQSLPAGQIVDVEPLTGGTQNVLIRFSRGGRRYVLRRPPLHKRANSDETMRREARVLSALGNTSVPHPELLAACSHTDVLGAAFYLMEAVTGASPRQALPATYVSDPTWRWRLGLAMADGIAAIGAVDYLGLGLSDLGRSEGYLERQVPRWRAQLESYSTFGGYPGAELPHLESIGEWLETNRPSHWEPGLIHGDYHLGNVLCALDSPALVAIVDWELTTIGDPLLDLGGLLATWPGPEGPSPGTVGAEPWDGFPSASDLVARYRDRTTRDLSPLPWYIVLACYKLGIILEGTYARALSGKAPVDTGERLHANALALFNRAAATIAAG